MVVITSYFSENTTPQDFSCSNQEVSPRDVTFELWNLRHPSSRSPDDDDSHTRATTHSKMTCRQRAELNSVTVAPLAGAVTLRRWRSWTDWLTAEETRMQPRRLLLDRGNAQQSGSSDRCRYSARRHRDDRKIARCRQDSGDITSLLSGIVRQCHSRPTDNSTWRRLLTVQGGRLTESRWYSVYLGFL